MLMPTMNSYRLTFSLSLLRSAILFGIILTSVGCNNQKSKELVLSVDSTQFRNWLVIIRILIPMIM